MRKRTKLVLLALGAPIACLLAALVIVQTLSGTGSPFDIYGDPAPFRPAATLFRIQSIDTMKHSRDLARAADSDPTFDAVIERDMSMIAASGATHAAIGTPYDREFLPVLRRWVESARSHGLKVWFRGNFSGWEGWFGYLPIGRSEHIAMTGQFILDNPGLFEDGDAFTPCPECENGGPGDPRQNGDTEGHRSFLLGTRSVAESAFGRIGRDIDVSMASMNLDVARLIMDERTASAHGGVVTIDNYRRTPDQFAADIGAISSSSGAKVAIGEFGAPIPDLQGSLSEEEQADFVERLMSAAYQHGNTVVAMNYWVLADGSTALIREDGSPKPAYDAVARYYKAPYALGTVRDEYGRAIKRLELAASIPESGPAAGYPFSTDEAGRYQIFLPYPDRPVTISDPDGLYHSVTISPQIGEELLAANDIVLVPKRQPLYERFLRFLGIDREL